MNRKNCIWLALWLPLVACTSIAYPPPTGPRFETTIGEPAPSADDAWDRALSLHTVRDSVLRHNPELAALKERYLRALADVKRAGALADPRVAYELRGQPFAEAYRLDHAQMHMVGIGETFAPVGALRADRNSAIAEAQMLAAQLDELALQIERDAKRVYAAYVQNIESIRIHSEHLEVANELVQLATLAVATSRASPADVLRMQAEAARIEADVGQGKAETIALIAELNALAGRAPDAPIAVPMLDDFAATLVAADRLTIADRALQTPEQDVQEAAVRRAEAMLQKARAEANTPTFDVQVNYEWMPTDTQTQGFGVMLQMTLPWLSGAHDADIEARQHEVAAEQSELDAVRVRIRAAVASAIARYRAARIGYNAMTDNVLPKTLAAFRATRSRFGTGGASASEVISALDSELQVELERAKAFADLILAVADLERYVGALAPRAM